MSELWTTKQVATFLYPDKPLEVALNAVKQLQWRGTIEWRDKVGKLVYYDPAPIRALRKKRRYRATVKVRKGK